MDNYIKTIINGLKAWVENCISVLEEKVSAAFASSSKDISTAQSRADNAYSQADNAYNRADNAYSQADNAYNRADNAYNRLAGRRVYTIFSSIQPQNRNEDVAYWGRMSSSTNSLIVTPQSGIFWRNTWMRPVLSKDGSCIGYGNLALLKKNRSGIDWLNAFERYPDTGEACALVYIIAEQSITGVVPASDTGAFGNLVITDYNECMASAIPLEQSVTLYSPNGTKYKITVSDDGTLTTEATT